MRICDPALLESLTQGHRAQRSLTFDGEAKQVGVWRAMFNRVHCLPSFNFADVVRERCVERP